MRWCCPRSSRWWCIMATGPGRGVHQSLTLPEAFKQYAPDFRYELCDLPGVSDSEVRGAAWLRAVLLLMKHISDVRLRDHLPEIFRMAREYGAKPDWPGFAGALLRYLATASETVTQADVRAAFARAMAAAEEDDLMATMAQQWIEEGRKKGLEEGLEKGQAVGKTMLVRLLEARFGSLAPADRQRIEKADGSAVLRLFERMSIARSVGEVFDPPGD